MLAEPLISIGIPFICVFINKASLYCTPVKKCFILGKLFERFTSAAMNIVNNYQSIGGLMKATGRKVSYYYNNVIVVTYDGKLQSVMIGSLKYFEKMK